MVTNKTFEEIHVGDTAVMERTLTKRDIDMFAILSGDMNPTHFSDEYALMLLERHKLVGHSMWGGSLISSLLGNDLPGPGTVYQSQHLDFHNAVELADTLTIRVSYLAKADSAGIVLGARVPIILTSRADSAEARLASCAVAVAYTHWKLENEDLKRSAAS